MANINFKNSELGPIPNDWEVKALGEIAEVKTGPFGSALHAEDYVMDGTPIITVEHIEHIKIDVTKGVPKVSEIDFKRLCAYTLKSGDLVFSRVGSVDRCSYVSDNENNWLFSGRLLRVRLNDNINPIYLAYHLNTEKAKQRVLSVAVGLAMPSINTKILSGIRVTLPPLPEQRRIAAALSDIDALIDNLDALIDKKRLIKQATMQQLLSGKKRINGFNDKWVEKKLGEIAETFTGLTYSPENISEYGTLVLRSSNIQNGVLTFDNNVFVNMDIPKRAMVQEDDILICVRNGSKDLIGKCALITKKALGMAFGAFMTVLRSKTVPQKFLLYLWQSEYVQKQVADNLGATINQITNADFDNFDVSLPPTLAEQTAISKILSDMDEGISLLEAKKEKYTAIKQGMMQQLLSGRVRLK